MGCCLLFLFIGYILKPSKLQPTSKINYELLVNDSLMAVVLLKEPLDKVIDTSLLRIIADSLFKHKPLIKDRYSGGYGVRFYYRRDWKDNIYFAGTFYSYDIFSENFKTNKLDVTYITGNDAQDEVFHKQLNPPIKTSFDTVAYLEKIKGLSNKEIKQLIKLQLNNSGEVGKFITLCKYQADSALIISNGNYNFSHFYHDHFINVWGAIFYNAGNNEFKYEKWESFEGCYDIFGNQVYFKSSLKGDMN